MSYILDALKKSESERARQAGPALMEVRIAQPRNRLPLWALLVGGLLLVNVAVLAVVLLMRERGGLPAAPASAPAAAALTAPAPAAPATAPVAAAAPPISTPLPTPSTLPAPPPDPNLTAVNPADYVPALPAGSAPLPVREAPEDTNLPSRDDLIAGGAQLPALHLSLHVYDPLPANRYVLINSSRLRQGESMPDGMHLERITESGVVLSWRGQRFTLQRGD